MLSIFLISIAIVEYFYPSFLETFLFYVRTWLLLWFDVQQQLCIYYTERRGVLNKGTKYYNLKSTKLDLTMHGYFGTHKKIILVMLFVSYLGLLNFF